MNIIYSQNVLNWQYFIFQCTQRVGTGEFDACVRLLRDLLLNKQCLKDALPWRQRCTIAGVEQPLLPTHRFQYVGVANYFHAYMNTKSSDNSPPAQTNGNGGGSDAAAFNMDRLAQRSRVNNSDY